MSDTIRSVVARAICKTGRFETGEGACAVLCMEALGCARQGCGHVERIHGKMADAIVADLAAARLAVLPVPEGAQKITLGPKVRRKLAIQAMDKKWLEIANDSGGEGICVRDYLDALYDAATRAGGRP